MRSKQAEVKPEYAPMIGRPPTWRRSDAAGCLKITHACCLMQSMPRPRLLIQTGCQTHGSLQLAAACRCVPVCAATRSEKHWMHFWSLRPASRDLDGRSNERIVASLQGLYQLAKTTRDNCAPVFLIHKQNNNTKKENKFRRRVIPQEFRSK